MNWVKRSTSLGDPYLEWAIATGFRGHSAAGSHDSRVPVIVKLKAQADLQTLVDTTWIDVPGAYRRNPAPVHVTGWAKRDRLIDLQTLVDRLEISLPVASGGVDPTPVMPAKHTSKRPIIAVIDRGCAFLNRSFRRAITGEGRHQTRLLAVWEQGEQASGNHWRKPAGFGYGREITRASINQLIKRAEGGESEQALYAQLGALGTGSGRLPALSHGTFVLDVAGGLPAERPGGAQAKPDGIDKAARADLLFVSAPVTSVLDTTGAGSAAYLLDAVHYVLHQAGDEAPVVINLSIGAQAGAHDGADMFSEALDEIIRNRRGQLAVTVAAGNGRRRRWNVSGVVPKEAPGAALVWRTLPSDGTDSFLELWMDPVSVQSPPSLQVQSPDGHESVAIAPGEAIELQDDAGVPRARLAYPLKNAFSKRTLALLSLAPSRHESVSSAAGRWTLRIANPGDQPVPMDAWIQRDEPPGGVLAPTQSFFEQVYPPAAVQIDGGSTLSDLAGAKEVLVVGAHTRASRGPSIYSAQGGPSRTVDILAEGDESPASFGLVAAGPISGSQVRMSGTSVSAAVAARQWINWRVAQPTAPGSPREFLNTLPVSRPVGAPQPSASGGPARSQSNARPSDRPRVFKPPANAAAPETAPPAR